MKRLVGVVTAVLFVAAACSGDGDGISVATGGGGDDWCDFARTVEASNDDLEFESSPEQLEAALGEFNDLLGEARSRAPGEISEAVGTAAETFELLEDELRKVDFEFFDLDFAAFEAIDTPESNAATEAIEIYNERECGIPREGGDSVDSSTSDAPGEDLDLPEDGTIRDQLIASFESIGFTTGEAECLANDVSFEDLSNAEDPSQLLEIFEQCGIPLDRLAELGG